MTITHHFQDDTLLAYAAGSLPEAFNLIVAAHISLCDDCRAVVESYDSLGGAVMEDTPAQDMSAGSLDAVLAQLDDLPPAPRRPFIPGTFPAPLRSYVGGDVDAVVWRNIGMGVKQAVLVAAREGTARLLLIPAGEAMPAHSHKGTEMTLVLQGAYADDDGRFARGDVEIADGDVNHTPVAEPGQDCVCLIVTDAPLKFKGIVPRIAQKLARI